MVIKNNQNKYLNIYGKTNSKFETEGTPFEIKEEKGGFNFSSGGFSFVTINLPHDLLLMRLHKDH